MRLAGPVIALPLLLLAGCAAGTVPPVCPTTFTLNVTPTAGAADHTVMAPGNQQQFVTSATFPATVPGCVYPQIATAVNWTSSDTIDLQLTPNPQTSTVVATCLNATETPATITATQILGGLSGKGTATLTCK